MKARRAIAAALTGAALLAATGAVGATAPDEDGGAPASLAPAERDTTTTPLGSGAGASRPRAGTARRPRDAGVDAGPDAADASVADLDAEAAVAAEDASLDGAEPDDAGVTYPGGEGMNAPVRDIERVQPEVRPVPREERPGVVIRTILGLVVLLGLAYAGGDERVRRLERRIGISQVVTAGFPFVALGVIARTPSVGVLTDSVLAELAPALRIGLGWLGFLIGFRFDARVLARVTRGTVDFAMVRSLSTFAVVVAACGGALVAYGSVDVDTLAEHAFLRDGLVLGAAGALTSLSTPRLLAARSFDRPTVRLVAGIARLEELVGVVALLVLASYFRSGASYATWQLPGTAWVLLTVGLGTSIGLLVYAVLVRERASHGEWVVLVLGSVAFAAGLSGKLQLSPVVVCFVVGLLLVNFPGTHKDGLRQALLKLERPIYLVFMVFVGALWDVADWHGWLLMVVFVVSRFSGRWVGTRIAEASADVPLTPAARQALSISPLGALSIAIVVTAQMLYPSRTVSMLVTAIIAGSMVTEIVFQLTTRRAHKRTLAAADAAQIEADAAAEAAAEDAAIERHDEAEP